jgi:acyl-CoA reductase-like NAD-dependent aldehyde dehydrogenase
LITMPNAGRTAETAGTLAVADPPAERLLADAPDCTRSQVVDEVMAGARQASHPGRGGDIARVAAMRAAADQFEESADELALILSAEHGQPLRECAAKVESSARWPWWYADPETDSLISSSPRKAVSEFQKLSAQTQEARGARRRLATRPP